MKAYLFACVVGLCVISPALAEDPVLVKNYFNDTKDGLVFVTDGWSVRSTVGLGWTSQKVADAEFLYSAKDFGGMVMEKGGTFVTRFPVHGNLSHDSQLGRQGGVADGVFSINFNPAWTRNECELTAGYNDPAAYNLVIFLGDDVQMVRLGSWEHQRAFLRQNVTRESKGMIKAREGVIVHKSGLGIAFKSTWSTGKDDKGKDLPPAEISAGMVKDPSGAMRLALVLPCKGMAKNALQLYPEPTNRIENLALWPTFRVVSSDDEKENVMGATDGVKNSIYGKDTKVDFNIDFTWLGTQPFEGFVEMDIIHSSGKKHFYERKEVKAAKGDAKGLISTHFDPKFTMPGVSEVWGRVCGADGRLIWVGRYRMCYDYESFKPSIVVQPDFKEFWDKTLAELRKTDLEPKTVRVKEYEDHPVLEVYEVTFNGWGGKRIYAMMYVPKERSGLLGAVVTAHPGTIGYGLKRENDGLFGSKVRQDLRFVTIVPLIRGFAPTDDANTIPFNNPWWGPLDTRDDYAARSWYCALVRAVDYLATRGDLVDMKKVVAHGGSQGGAFALVTAALDHRIAYCFADCPANCQPHELIDGLYPSFGPTAGQVPAGQTAEDTKKVLSYYNPVNFAPLITCPAYVGSNIGDLTVHSAGPLAAYHNLTALPPDKKAFYPGHHSHFHGSGPGLGVKMKEIYELLGGPVKPTATPAATAVPAASAAPQKRKG